MIKKILSITIDETIFNAWKQYVEDECINSSQLIERKIKDYLDKRNKK